MKKEFVHLHNHTAYSLLDGASKINDIVERAKELGMSSLAITDHGVMYGVIDFYRACKKAGIKPIIGCEVYVAPNGRFDKRARLDDQLYHLVLLAKDEVGYRNLIKLVSKAWLEGFYYKPRIDKELLTSHSDGLIALSACLGGEVASLLRQDHYQEAKEVALWYSEVFGEGNYYLEIENHGIYEQIKTNNLIAHLSEETGIPLVATNDTHYVTKEDARIQDVLMCIQMGKTYTDEKRMKFDGQEFYIKDYDEMYQMLGEYPEALSNTVKIAEQCNLDFTFGENHMPIFETPNGESLEEYLEFLCQQGLIERYGTPSEEAYSRLEFELNIIKQMGYAGYFLIVWDFIRFARESNIYVGPGRGSAAGSIVSYVLRITDVDPLKYDLLFERFLNPERVSMPDIDIDFCFERRSEVIDYVIEKYGQDRVCQIITFGTMAAKGAIRDVGRVLDIPLSTVDKVAKLIPNELGMTINKALTASSELREMMEENEQVKDMVETAKKLEGMPRHAGTHAAGVVISQKELDYYLPLSKTNDGGVTTQFAKENVEDIGLLKMDLLGLRTLTVINKAIEMVEITQGIKIDFDQIDLDDQKTYELLGKGESIGVFQLESGGLRAILKELKPSHLEDIIALVALYRPGPLGSGMVEDFIERKHGRKSIEYLHPLLEPILKPTYGVILYQEQVMRIASDLAGFSLGEADLLRRAMGKKKPEIIAGLKQQFIEGATGNQISVENAKKIFELIEFFAGYGFNKSHSAAYAVVAFQTAYLKANYPVEYMAALLTSVIDSSDKVPFYISECKDLGIDVLPPDVNVSRENFIVSKGAIRFGLAAIKNVGKSAIHAILEARDLGGEFESLQDFCARVDIKQVNKRVIENLINSGAFSSTGGNRVQLCSILATCIDQAHQLQKSYNSNQISLFDVGEEAGFTRSFESIELPSLQEHSKQEVLKMEKDLLGLYVSGHPLDEHRDLLKNKVSKMILEVVEEDDQGKITIGGIISYLRLSTTKRGELMAYCTIEDLTGKIDVLIFPRILEQYRDLIQQDQMVLIHGRVNYQEDVPKIFAESIQLLNSQNNLPIQDKKIYLKIDEQMDNSDFLNRLKFILRQHIGNVPVYLYFSTTKKMILADQSLWVCWNNSLEDELVGLLSLENISIRG